MVGTHEDVGRGSVWHILLLVDGSGSFSGLLK